MFEPLEHLKYGNCGCRDTFVPLLKKIKARPSRIWERGNAEAAVHNLKQKLKITEESNIAKDREVEEWKKRHDGYDGVMKELKKEHEEKVEKLNITIADKVQEINTLQEAN